MSQYTGLEIAVIGMSGRFPGAGSIEDFWSNLKNGVESIHFFSDEELINAGENKDRLNHPMYIKAASFLQDKECFDAEFFGFIPSEVKLLDPQVRIFHEECWKAIEDAGYSMLDSQNKIGLFAGASSNLNWEMYAGISNMKGEVDEFSASQLRNARYLATRIAYALNLSGPSVFIDTACSTSLVAIHHACKSLLVGDCNIAMAGGVSVGSKTRAGYVYQEGMINSRDGHCRAFDKEATGTISGEGCGVVILKTLKNALKDGDHIYAVIRGSGVNNDGNNKVGFTAPSVEGQATVIMTAQKWAKTEPESITYIEAHGTGTSLGDPIEIAGLTRAFGTDKKQYCAIGSVKTNIGHLDAAAGVAGLIKTVLALQHRQLPPSLHFTTPNPKIDFTNSPFYVNTELKEWKSNGYPLRAGVSSFGIGGTNAHVIVEEAPVQPESSASSGPQLLLFSAKTPAALQRNIERFSSWLKANEKVKLADIAYTLQTGRASFEHRQLLVCDSHAAAIEALPRLPSTDNYSHVSSRHTPVVVFMFSGQGSQYAGMCGDLYEQEPVFKAQVDSCCELVKQRYQKDLLPVMFPGPGGDSRMIDNTEYTQPALFIIEYALAMLLESRGIRPAMMIGHSIGEYTAACLSGVFSLEDALHVVVKRGELMQQATRGSMLSVSVSEAQLRELLKEHPQISLAAVNSSQLCAVSGSNEAIEVFEQAVKQSGHLCRPIRTSHAFHSWMMDEVLDEYAKVMSSVRLQAPQRPFISNVSGVLATAAQITTPGYWVEHLRQTVRFGAGIESLFINKEAVFIEVGPGRVLSSLVQLHGQRQEGHRVVSMVKQAKEAGDDQHHLLRGIGALWLNGLPVNWQSFYKAGQRRRVSLPGYSFERTKYVAEADAAKLLLQQGLKERRGLSESIHALTWVRSVLPNKANEADKKEQKILIFSGEENFSNHLAGHLADFVKQVVEVKCGESLTVSGKGIEEATCDDLDQVWEHINKQHVKIDHIIYCPTLDILPAAVNYDNLDAVLNKGYLRLCSLAKLLSQQQDHKIYVTVITNQAVQVLDDDEVNPLKACMIAPVKIMPTELLHVDCKIIDIPFPFENTGLQHEYAGRMVNELFYKCEDRVVAYRYRQRWTPSYEVLQDNEQVASNVKIESNGTYIVTGGFGGMGFTIAENICLRFNANVILLHRSAFPKRKDWQAWLETHGKEDLVSRRIEQLLAMEAPGGKIALYKADVGNEQDVMGFFEWVKTKYAKINGIIWAAGEVDYGGIMQNRMQDGFLSYTRSKIHGLLLFEKYYDFKTLDFLSLFSSIGNTFYELKFGQVAYNAANEFMDSYAYYARKKNIHAFTIEWCDWLTVGMTVKIHQKKTGSNDSKFIDSQIKDGIYPEEGIAIFQRCLQNKAVSTVIYTGDLIKEIRDNKLRLRQFIADNTGNSEKAVQEMENDLSPLHKRERLIQLFADFFAKGSITEKDDFFELGGDSLKAMTLVARINQKLHCTLTIADFYKYSTIAELAAFLNKESENRYTDHIPKSAPKPSYVVSAAQKRMFLLQEIDRDSIAYNEYKVLRLKGIVDTGLIEEVFKQLIKRHECLRTSFILEDGSLRQVIAESVPFGIVHFESSEEHVDNIMRAFVRPFDLGVAPLIRVGLIRFSEQEHLLIVDLHHIIADGVSKDILIKEFIAHYQGETLPPLALQYKDYAEWQQQVQDLERIAVQRSFWMNELAGDIHALELPLDYPRPALKNESGDSYKFKLNVVQTAALNNIAAGEGVSMFMVLLTVYNILLSKLSNQQDIVVGIPTAGRQHADLENMIGMFVNTLPVRIYPKEELRFKELLSAVKESVLAALENQDYQYEDMIEALQIRRDTSRNPLFDVMLYYRKIEELSALQLPGAEITSYDTEYRVSKFDLTLDVWECNEELYLSFEYCTALFRQETIKRFSGYLEQIVHAIIQDAGIPVSDISILPEEEQRCLLYEFNNTDCDYPSEETIVSLFYKQVNLTPDNTALVFEGKQLSYRELDEASTRIACSLRVRYQVRPNTIIAILANRSEKMIIGLLGILKSGAAYLPIDPQYPADRIAYMLEDSGANVLLICEPLSAGIKCQSMIAAYDSLAENDLDELPVVNTSTDLCYLIYTSGSTGKPKGVKICHQSVVNFMEGMNREIPLQAEDGMLAITSTSFDISVLEIFWTICNGVKVILHPSDISVNELDRYVTDETGFSQHRITMLQSTPSFVRMIDEGNRSGRFLHSLRALLIGGDMLPVALVQKIQRENKAAIYNMYGPTETTIWSCIHKFESDVQKVRIGKPIANTQIYILNKYLHLVPVGVPGDLYIGGEGLSVGYHNRPELTAQRFIANPFKAESKIYMTGDVARWLPDGTIELVGRTDNQIKIRGYRIELGEIEHQITRYEGIKEVVVMARERQGDKYLVAYYVSHQSIEPAILRNNLQQSLPDYMVPSFFVQLESLPLTANGKLDRNALPEPVAVIAETYVAPVNLPQQMLCAIWANVLGIDKVGIRDNFFSVGGDSIRSIQIIARLRTMGYELTAKDIFSCQTIEALASRLKRIEKDAGELIRVKDIELQPEQRWFFAKDDPSVHKLNDLQLHYGSSKIYPLSPMQEGMLFHTLFETDGEQYFEQISYELEGLLDIAAVERSLHELVANHDILRTIFLSEAYERPLQIVLNEWKPAFSYFDVTEECTQRDEASVMAFYKETDRSGKFEIGIEPPVRLTVYRISATTYTFIWSYHHILMDGWCMSILINDFKNIYRCLTKGERIQLPPAKPYVHYIQWLESQEKNIGLQYWRQYLQGYETVCTLPGQQVASGNRRSSISLNLSSEQTHSLQQLSVRYGVTMNILMQAAWGILLSKYNNIHDVVFGSVVSGRPALLAGVEEMIGLFINTIPVRVRFEEKDTVAQLLQRLQQEMLESEPYHYHSLAQIQSLSLPGRDLLDHLLVFENYPVSDKLQEATDDTYRITKVDMFELTNYNYVIVIVPGRELFIRLDYNSNRFEQENMELVLIRLQQVINKMIENAEMPAAALAIVSEEEAGRLLFEWNDTQIDYSQHKSIIDLFEEQVIKDPSRAAIRYEGKLISYGQLLEQSDKVAFYLQQQGVQPGDLVGLILPRNEHLIPSILGVLKSGAAYVPIDPQYPQARIMSVIHDAGLRIILTTATYRQLPVAVDVAVIDLTEKWALIQHGPPIKYASCATPGDLAYVIYTSGSTGKPKGVAIEHQSLVNYINWSALHYVRGEQDVFPLYTSISFDLTVTSIFTPLVTGNLIIIYEEQENQVLVDRVFSDNMATVIKLTPSHLKIIRDSDDVYWHAEYKRKKLIVGGENLESRLAKDIYEKFKGEIEIYNEYGPTEATVGCMIYKYDTKDSFTSVPIGHPVANTGIYIFDQDLNITPIGVKGELYIGGAGLARGYFNNEKLTSGRFINNPFIKGERMYKTGDVARRGKDGVIEYLGRMDEQVKIRGYRIELGEIEQQLNSYEGITESVVLVHEKEDNKFLVAYYVSEHELGLEALKNYLLAQLPEYMVPSFFMHLHSLPLTGNGKLDRKALPEPSAAIEKTYVAPVTKEQQILSDIWAKVLGADRIGIRDNFFAAGGDSIKSIQIVARVRAAGYELTVKDIFSSQTIEALALRLKRIEKKVDQSMVTGDIELSPVQRWFFAQDQRDPHHYNQAVMLQFKEGLKAEAIRKIFGKIQEHHDGLRTRFRKVEGGWQPSISSALNLEVSVTEHDFTNEKDESEKLKAACDEIQSSIDLEHGPLMKLGLFHLKDGCRLLIVIHHMVIDGVSWRILFEDIETLFQQYKQQQVLTLPLKTHSFGEWVNCLRSYIQLKSFKETIPYWNAILDRKVTVVTRDMPEGRNLVKDMVTGSIRLDGEQTAKLLTEVHKAYHTRINDVLLVCLLAAMHRCFCLQAVKIDLEGHGREAVAEGLDISRTVGWFTSIYPVVLEYKEGSIAVLVKEVKEYLRKVPDNGISYLIGRYLAEMEELNPGNDARIVFNYLGQFDADTQGKLYQIASGPLGEVIAIEAERNYDWEITGMVLSGELVMNLSYSKYQYNNETVNSFLETYKEELEKLIDHCCQCGYSEWTPSDLTYKKITIEQLDALQHQYEIRDIYPLSPMQEGMLFVSLLESEADHYFEQMSYRVEGIVDIAAVKRTLYELANRYDVLRTKFVYQGYERPLQIVLEKAVTELNYNDVTDRCNKEGEYNVIANCKAADRSIKFDFSEGTLMRLSIYKTGETTYTFIWSYHHILMDGWCISILINDFRMLYGGLKEGKVVQLPAVKPYAHYIQWLQDRDKEAGLQYWERYLEGYEAQATLPMERSASLYRQASVSIKFSIEETRLLQQLSARYRTTVSTVMQVAWAVLLGKYNNVQDVVFGAVVSGRPAEIPGVEEMVGLFINTVPVRICFDEKDTIAELLQRLQQEMLESTPYHYFSLAEIQSLTPLGNNLLDHVLVFENFPVSDKIRNATEESYTITDVEIIEQTNYPYAVIILPGKELTVKLDYNANSYNEASMTLVLTHLKKIIEQILFNTNISIEEVGLYNEVFVQNAEEITH